MFCAAGLQVYNPRNFSLVPVFGYNRRCTLRSGYVCDGLEAVCVVLRRLATPCRLSDIEHVFGRHSSALSEIFWECLETFVIRQMHLVTTFKAEFLRTRCRAYAKSIFDRGAALNNCVGFIDCTKIQMARPGGRGSNQRANYSGHKRFHCFSYQTITLPDGLIFSVYGPEDGRRHDITLYSKRNMDEKLSN
jgi:DDE superfamily endonuclease